MTNQRAVTLLLIEESKRENELSYAIQIFRKFKKQGFPREMRDKFLHKHAAPKLCEKLFLS